MTSPQMEPSGLNLEKNDEKDGKKETPKLAPFRELLRYSTGCDCFLIIIGIISSSALGASTIVISSILGELTNVLGK